MSICQLARRIEPDELNVQQQSDKNTKFEIFGKLQTIKPYVYVEYQADILN